MTYNELSETIIGVAIDIHRKLGPGLLESVYQHILVYELRKRGLSVRTEEPVPLIWDKIQFVMAFRADLIVEEMILVEIKSLEELASVHKRQLLTYLRVMDRRLGLLVNFGDEVLKDGIRRVINGTLPDDNA
ncbi:MAG TPA: GxxExxY protein [Pirellulaceae bacterium]|nr:GxxExxY protein [Pirellulaceae bacterium]